LIRWGDFDLRGSMQAGGRNVAGSRSRLQSVFVVVEMALALVLLTGAGLMLRTMAGLWRVDPGFDPRHAMTFGVSLRAPKGGDAAATVRGEMRALQTALAQVPGVEAVAESWEAFPLGGDDEKRFWIDGQPRPPSENEMNWTLDYVVSPEYLRAMKIPLVRGRFFTEADDERAPRVAVVDEVFAAKYFAGQDPVGKRVRFSGETMATIVGTVKHVRQWGLDSDDTNSLRAQMYLHTM